MEHPPTLLWGNHCKDVSSSLDIKLDHLHEQPRYQQVNLQAKVCIDRAEQLH